MKLASALAVRVGILTYAAPAYAPATNPSGLVTVLSLAAAATIAVRDGGEKLDVMVLADASVQPANAARDGEKLDVVVFADSSAQPANAARDGEKSDVVVLPDGSVQPEPQDADDARQPFEFVAGGVTWQPTCLDCLHEPQYKWCPNPTKPNSHAAVPAHCQKLDVMGDGKTILDPGSTCSKPILSGDGGRGSCQEWLVYGPEGVDACLMCVNAKQWCQAEDGGGRCGALGLPCQTQYPHDNFIEKQFNVLKHCQGLPETAPAPAPETVAAKMQTFVKDLLVSAKEATPPCKGENCWAGLQKMLGAEPA